MTQNHLGRATHPRRIAATTFAVLALAAPAATARPIVDHPIDVPPEPGPAAPVQASDERFDWRSAGIGAAATAGLILVATGGVAATHRGGPRSRSVDGTDVVGA
jgi:hypothetical protein